MRWMWARRKKSRLPTAYVLVKRKKNWSTARCIVQYNDFFLSKALKATGRILTLLTSEVFNENTFNCTTVDSLLKQVTDWNQSAEFMHKHLGQHSDVQLHVHADDLVGFFPSVDQGDMIACAEYALESFCRTKGRPPHELVISVPTHAACQCFSGKYDGEGSHRPFFLEFLLPFLRYSLEASVLEYAGDVIRQHRGGPIGSPCSPPWLILCVCRAEYNWINSLTPPSSLRGKWWQTSRYVDNRFTVSLAVNGHIMAPASLFSKTFYGKAVILEEEEKSRLCGADILKCISRSGAFVLETRYFVEGYPDVLPQNRALAEELQWKYRTPSSASTKSSLMSAFNARLHLSKRLSSTPERRRQAICRVCTVYLLLGYRGSWLSSYFFKFAHTHLRDASAEWIRDTANALRNGDIVTIHEGGK